MKYYRRQILRRPRRRRMRGRGAPEWLKKAGEFIGKMILLPGIGGFL